jgi:hypothetical protein
MQERSLDAVSSMDANCHGRSVIPGGRDRRADWRLDARGSLARESQAERNVRWAYDALRQVVWTF